MALRETADYGEPVKAGWLQKRCALPPRALTQVWVGSADGVSPPLPSAHRAVCDAATGLPHRPRKSKLPGRKARPCLTCAH